MRHSPSPFRPVLLAVALAGFSATACATVAGFDSIFGRPTAAIVKPKPGAAADFYAKADALADEAGKLAPDDAVKRWLALADDYAAVPREAWWRENSRPYDRRGFASLVAALPPVAAWDALVAGIAARKPAGNSSDLALRTLAVALGDTAGREAAIKAVRHAIVRREKRFPNNPDAAQNLREVLFALLTPGSPEAIAAEKEAWEKQLASLDRSQSRMNGRAYIGRVPDLVKLYGEERARTDLQKLCLAGANLSNLEGDRLKSLLSEVALANVGKLPAPVWEAVTDTSDPALFEALDKKFPSKPGDDDRYEKQNARSVYLTGLLNRDRLPDAIALAVRTFHVTGETPFPYGWSAKKAVKASRLTDYCAGILKADPAAPVLENYMHAAASAGRTAEFLKCVRDLAARKDLPPEARNLADDFETAALLADDKPDEAIPRLLAVAKTSRPKKPESGDSPEARVAERAYDNAVSRIDAAGTRLIALGQVLGRTDLTDAGIASLDAAKDPGNDSWSVFDALFRAGRHEEIEKRAAALLLANGASGDDNDYEKRHIRENALAALVRLYHDVDRHADAVAVLEKSPAWNAPDLRGVTGEPKTFLADIADSLAAVGRKDDALRVAGFAVARDPGNDAGYAALLKLTTPGDAFLKRMDAQFAKDRFEERPLIWKAKALYDLGRYDEALADAKAAVAIDPSDGEEGKGDRMRAYAVLADILEKKGDAATAKTYRGVVAAIRTGEDADDIYAAGLLKRALARWEESLTSFADAYCVQSRLALRYAEAGDMAKAEKHYARAFELMPDSFGRIESHCFGCEGAFEGETAQDIAGRVFAGIVAKSPDNPRAHYLLGYLREAQGRFADAAGEYRKAVALDPDYFNAWSKLRALRESADLSPEEAGRCARAMLRLDPYGRHGGGAEEIDDLRFVVTTLAAAGVGMKPDTTPVLPLPAAKARLEKGRSDESRGFQTGWSPPDRSDRTLADIIRQNRLVRLAGNIADSGE